MPRNLCTERRKPATAHLQHRPKHRQPGQRWTLALAILSIVCAAAEAWWMGLPGV
jgi:hypothetical protein